MLKGLFISLALIMSLGLSQELDTASQSSKNPFNRLIKFIDQISSSEEHLLHQERVGSYLVNADGQRLVEHPYLKFSITKDGQAIGVDSIVGLESVLYVNNQEALKRSYIAVYDGTGFLIDPLDLSPLSAPNNSSGGWFTFTLSIDSDAGKESRDFGLDYFPPRPEAGLLFRLTSTLIPILTLILIVALFKILGLNRNQKTLSTAQQTRA